MTETAPTEYANEPTPETETQPEGAEIVAHCEALMGQRLLKKLHEEIAQLGQPWVNTPEREQNRIIDRMRNTVEAEVRGLVSTIAGAGFAWAPSALESLTIKDGAKATLILTRGTEAMHAFADRVGSAVVVVFADPQEYLERMHEIKAMADQPRLPLDEPVEAEEPAAA